MAMMPPPDETSAQRAEREARQREAKRISDDIDAEIEATRRRIKNDTSVKVLLLGQSESGKSTTLKQFQLIFAAKEFNQERNSWKFVIQLNLVRSIRIILEQLSALTTTKPIPFEDNKPARTIHPSSPLHGSPGLSASTTNLTVSSHSSGMSSDSDLPSTVASVASPPSASRTSYPKSTSSPITPTGRSPQTPFPSSPLPPPQIQAFPTSPTEMPKLDDYHRTLRMRLLPLLHLETSILRRLDPSGEDYEATQLGTNWAAGGKEFMVRSTSNWKEKLAQLRAHNSVDMHYDDGYGYGDAGSTIDFDDPEDPSNVIQACKDDMIALWQDPVVRQVLHVGNVRLEEMPGFFLDDIERLAAPGYVPSDEDILKARLKTVGVSEYEYHLSILGEKNKWIFYDVGGARTQRAAWQPYFSHVDAIIFLAPISAFDQPLAEDHRVNRLEDSLLLFKSICKSVLLKEVNIVLFLSKIDILQSKLNRGIKVAKYVKSYGDRPNEFESVARFFRNKFVSINKEYTPRDSRRMFYAHTTCVTETQTMRGLLSSVIDSIFRANLQLSNLT